MWGISSDKCFKKKVVQAVILAIIHLQRKWWLLTSPGTTGFMDTWKEYSEEMLLNGEMAANSCTER